MKHKQKQIGKWRSPPECVTATLIATKDGKMVGCEGLEIPVGSNDFIGWEYCYECPIGRYCWLRLHHILLGGE